MNIIVCIKQVPSTETAPRPCPDPPYIEAEGVTWVMNPFDEFAVEEAVRVKERLGKGEITVVSYGPERTKEAFMRALAMGADRALHILGETDVGVDSYITASVLFQVIKKCQTDLILCGKEAVDDQSGAVGIQLAELLNIPHGAGITKLNIDTLGKATVHKPIEGGVEVLECPLPALFTCHKGLNEPRYPSLPGIMGAKKKPYETIPVTEIAPKEVLRLDNRLTIKDLTVISRKRVCKKLQTAEEEMAKSLIAFLHEEVKII